MFGVKKPKHITEKKSKTKFDSWENNERHTTLEIRFLFEKLRLKILSLQFYTNKENAMCDSKFW